MPKKSFMEAVIADINRERQHGVFPQQPPTIHAFGDWDYYYLADELVWEPNEGQSLPPVKVPKGFVTDLLSVPRWLWWLVPRTGRYTYPAVVHDYLYWVQRDIQRPRADTILETAMKDAGVQPWQVWLITWAVRTFGQSAWNEDTRLKQSGEKRFLNLKEPPSRLVSWEDWKKDPAHFCDTP